jgi:uncharacterized damage-inducible protein DinB
MRGTHAELDVLRRAVVHALELAEEDVERSCGGLGDEAMFARPGGLHPTEQTHSAGTPGVAPVAFHLRHMARSLDRLLTYAEGRMLDEAQMEALKTELEGGGSAAEVMREFREGIARASERVREFAAESYEEARGVGRKRLLTTVGGLLIHCAEHTARHVGQAVTTAKLVRSRSVMI